MASKTSTGRKMNSWQLSTLENKPKPLNIVLTAPGTTLWGWILIKTNLKSRTSARKQGRNQPEKKSYNISALQKSENQCSFLKTSSSFLSSPTPFLQFPTFNLIHNIKKLALMRQWQQKKALQINTMRKANEKTVKRYIHEIVSESGIAAEKLLCSHLALNVWSKGRKKAMLSAQKQIPTQTLFHWRWRNSHTTVQCKIII